MKWLLIVAAIALLIFFLRPQAEGDILHATYNRSAAPHQTKRSVQDAERIAERYWGGTRCRSIAYQYADLPEPKVAQARWSVFVLASRVYFSCSITFDSKIRTLFPLYCATVVHEFGHLNGQAHVGGRDNIMFETINNRNIPEVCKV